MFRKLLAPVSVQWEIASACNLTCVHCYNYWRSPDQSGNLAAVIGAADKVRVVDELIRNGVFHVTITGGEPVLCILRYKEELVRLREAGISVSVNTNLSLLQDEHLELIKFLQARSVLTSLMSYDKATHDALSGRAGSFEATCRNATRAIESGIAVAFNMVVTKRNAKHVIETGKLAKRLGATAFCATKASKPGSCSDFSDYHLDKKELQQMFRDLLFVKSETGLDVDSLEHYPACSFLDSETRSVFGGRNCSAGKTGCSVGFDGSVRPCSHAMESYGNISHGLDSAWLAMREWREGALVPERCKTECKEYPLRCGGGCRVEAKNWNDSLAGIDPYCQGGNSPKRIPKRLPEVDLASTFIPFEELRFRKEELGSIVYRSPKLWLILDDPLVKCIEKAENGFTSAQLADIYNVSPEETRKTLRLLVFKKLVNEVARNP